MTVKHKFIDAHPDDPNRPDLVRPSNWNDDHDVNLSPSDLPTITLTGDVTGAAADGSVPTTLADTAVTPGSYTNTNLTVDSKGRITLAANGTTSGGVSSFNTRTGAVTLTSGDVQTALGYIPLNQAAPSFGGSAASLTTARNIAITGDLAWNVNFDGSAAVTAAGTLSTVNANVGSFTNANITVNAKGLITAAASGTGGTGTVTTTGSPVSGNLTKFTGATSISNGDLSGDITTSGTLATTLATVNANVGSFTNANITVNAKGLITAAANGSSGGGGTVTSVALASPNSTISLGGTNPVTGSGTINVDVANTAVTPGSYTNTNLTVDATGRITAAANGSAGAGTVTTTGSPASGNLSKFSGATSITNGDLSGDVTTSGTLAATIKTDVALAGNPTTTTQTAGDNSTKIATTAFVQASFPTATTLVAAASADITPGTSYTDVTGASVNLTAGTWLIVAQVSATFNSATSTCYSRLFNSTDSTNINAMPVSGNNAGFFYSMALLAVVTIASGTKTIKLQCKHDSTGNWTINHTVDGGISATGIAATKLSN